MFLMVVEQQTTKMSETDVLTQVGWKDGLEKIRTDFTTSVDLAR